MQRRTFMQGLMAGSLTAPLFAALQQNRLEAAAEVLEKATSEKQVESAVLHVQQGQETFTRHFGQAKSGDAMFLLGSITKPINVAAVMTLFDQGKFQLNDLVKKFIPTFTGDGRETITIQQLCTHVSGLPDQSPENNELRKRHATLGEFVEQTLRTPLLFSPGTKYGYSSMGILLVARIGEVVSGLDMLTLVERAVFQPLGMKHSAQGVGRFQLGDFVRCQTEGAAPESGAGDPQAKEWDWNSPYWRKLGAPWGGTHASAPDIAKFLTEFMEERGAAIKPQTARLMKKNHNPAGFTQRGIGFHVGMGAGAPGCSEQTFGHSGSTGTLCWADPKTKTICVVLTSLPRRGAKTHPRELAANLVATAAK